VENSDFYRQIRETINSEIRKRGYTIEEFTRKVLGMSSSNYNRKFNTGTIRVSDLIKITKELGIKLDIDFIDRGFTHKVLEEPEQKYLSGVYPPGWNMPDYLRELIQEIKENNELLKEQIKHLKTKE